jgi:hypothetical protein
MRIITHLILSFDLKFRLLVIIYKHNLRFTNKGIHYGLPLLLNQKSISESL